MRNTQTACREDRALRNQESTAGCPATEDAYQEVHYYSMEKNPSTNPHFLQIIVNIKEWGF